MKILQRIATVILVLFIVTSGLMIITGLAGEKKSIRPAGSELNTKISSYLHVYAPLSYYYPGDEGVAFYIRVYNDYDGSLWNDPDPGDDVWDNHLGGDGYDLDGAKVTIGDILDENHNPVTDPTDVFDKTVYNGATGGGFQISSSVTYYATSSNDYITMDIANSVKAGIYVIPITVTFKIRTSWDAPGVKFVLSGTKSEVEYITFEVRSGIEPGPSYDNEIQASGYNDKGIIVNGGQLYAGATFQEIRIPINAKSYSMESLQATFTPTKVTLAHGAPAKMAYLSAWSASYFSFRIDVPATLTPQFLTGSTLTVTYSRDIGGTPQTISENAIQILFIVSYTPIVSPPDNNNMQTVAATVHQGDTTNDFASLTFTNSGNVELQDIEVSLDISDARFFNNGEFYYDEGDYGTTKPLTDITVLVEGPIQMSSTLNVDFPATLINKYLPPGKYKIPIEYTAWYFDTGELAGSTSWRKTTEDEYTEIMEAMTGNEEEPFIFLEVKDDNGLSLEVTTNNALEKGEQSATLSLTISNLEYYPLTEVTFKLGICPGITAIDPERSVATLPAANEVSGPGSSTIDFLVNVDEKVTTGIREGELIITGCDLCGDEVGETIVFNYEITPIPAKVTVIGIETSGIAPGKEFQLTVDVMNIGGSGANNVSVLLALNNNLLSTSNNKMAISSVPVGTMKSVTFKVDADKTIERGAVYPCDIYLSWTDANDNTVKYADNPPVDFEVGYDLPVDSATMEVVGMITSGVKPGKSFELTIEVMNIGGSTAKNISVLLALNTNLLYTEQNEQTISSLPSGDLRSVKFTVAADPNLERETDYTGQVYLKWTDSEGNLIQYDDNTPSDIVICCQEQEEEPFMSPGAAYLTIGIIVALVLIVFAVLMFVGILMIRPKGPKEEKEKKKDDKKSKDSALPTPGQPGQDQQQAPAGLQQAPQADAQQQQQGYQQGTGYYQEGYQGNQQWPQQQGSAQGYEQLTYTPPDNTLQPANQDQQGTQQLQPTHQY